MGMGSSMSERLATLPKGHPLKLKLAEMLRAETTMTVGSISKRLSMGTRGHLVQQFHRATGAADAFPQPDTLQINLTM